MTEVICEAPTGLRVEIAYPQEGELAPEVIDWVLEQSKGEDVRPVDGTDLLTSFATYVAYVSREADEPAQIAGFLRQRSEDNVGFRMPGGTLYPNELGTLLVDRNFRGKKHGVADALVRSATTMMTHPVVRSMNHNRALTPVAVCNPAGKATFSRNGFTPIGQLGADRTVQAYFPDGKAESVVEELAHAYIQTEFAKKLSGLERYAGMSVIEHPLLSVA